MSQKKAILASAILAGLVSGMAIANDPAMPKPALSPDPENAGGTKVEKKNECKGMKNECKGMKGKKHKHKKGEKEACSGPNGCPGNMKKDAPAPADAPKTN